MTRSHHVLRILFCSLLSIFLGCPSTQDPELGNQECTESKPAASAVPVRLWVVSEVSDLETVKRQWKSVSEQPIEIRTFTVIDFLNEKNCDCDAVAYPSRLLGEMIDRNWIIKLPSSLNPKLEPTNEDSDVTNKVPRAWIRQVDYGGDTWAVPMGCSVPVVVVNSKVPDTLDANADWLKLAQSVGLPEVKKPIEITKVDRVALVDRFLCLVSALTDRSPEYGMLFDLQTLTPRLTEPEFVEAANLLHRIGSQHPSALGGWSESWQWVASSEQPAVTVVAPTLISKSAAEQSNLRALRLPSDPKGWNTGSGLIISISANCRQSARTIELLKWLKTSETRKALAPFMVGIESPVPWFGSDSAAWQATQLNHQLAASSNIPQELNLARTEEYRTALVEQLLSMLEGKQDAATALKLAADQWQIISQARKLQTQRMDYERSLGLKRD